jgi:putative phage-type endonuclease
MYYTEEEQLERLKFSVSRMNYIGASDISTLLNENKYSSLYQLYLSKTDKSYVEEQQRNASRQLKEAGYFGDKLEQLIAETYARKHNVSIQNDNKLVKHPEYDFLAVNVDRWCDNYSFILECKTASLLLAKSWSLDQESESIPLKYHTQVAFQSAVVNAHRKHYKLEPVNAVAVAVLIGGQTFRTYKYLRDVEYEASLISLAKKFWQQHVCLGNAPLCRSDEDVKLKYPASTDSSIEADEAISSQVDKLLMLKASNLDRSKHAQLLESSIKEYMNTHDKLTTQEGNVLATYTSYDRNEFDRTSFKKKHPDLFKEFTKKGTSRRFSITKESRL